MTYPTAQFTEAQKRKILTRLQGKGIRGACPMCNRQKFVLVDGYITNMIQPDLSGGLKIGGPTVPTVAVVCENCGFFSQHALGVLGLLDPSTREVKK